MPFDLSAVMKQSEPKAKDSLATLGVQKVQEALGQVNELLKLLQDAGYEVSQLAVELGLPPTVTIDLKIGPAVNESKLNAVLQANRDKELAAAILAALVEANQLRGSVNVETLELKGAKIVLKASPNITLQWKEAKASA